MAPGDRVGVTIGETVFICVYNWGNIFKIIFSRTTGPKELKFT
jgi:hypothetical protein